MRPQLSGSPAGNFHGGDRASFSCHKGKRLVITPKVCISDTDIVMALLGRGRRDCRRPGVPMRLFLTGVSCAGKSTIGAIIAEFLGVRFFDLDLEVEAFFKTSIERLQKRYINMREYRNEAANALEHLLTRPESEECVIAMSPAGLMGGYLRVLKKHTGIRVVITDKP